MQAKAVRWATPQARPSKLLHRSNLSNAVGPIGAGPTEQMQQLATERQQQAAEE